jgi:hypothetical protein
MDKEFEIKSSTGPAQYFSMEGMQAGMYRAQVQWTIDGKEFYVEEMIQL